MNNCTNSAPVLHIEGLYKKLGSRQVLNGITLDVTEGEIFGFLGPNGSGKTTTIKLMLGLLNIDQGAITICGHDVKRDFEAAMKNIGGIIENPELYKYLSGYENLMQCVRTYGDIPKERIDQVIRMVRLENRIHDKVGKYSLGMRQRLGVAQALLNRPRLLVLDEPTNGLDPAGIKELRDILKYITRYEGTAVFVSSHQLAELDQICDRVGIIDRGNLLAVKTMDEIRNANRGDHEQFYIDTPEVAAAIELIFSIGATPELQGERILVTSDRSVCEYGISETIRLLALENIPITGAQPVHRSLEDAFLQYTTGNMSAGGSI